MFLKRLILLHWVADDVLLEYQKGNKENSMNKFSVQFALVKSYYS